MIGGNERSPVQRGEHLRKGLGAGGARGVAGKCGAAAGAGRLPGPGGGGSGAACVVAADFIAEPLWEDSERVYGGCAGALRKLASRRLANEGAARPGSAERGGLREGLGAGNLAGAKAPAGSGGKAECVSRESVARIVAAPFCVAAEQFDIAGPSSSGAHGDGAVALCRPAKQRS